MKEIDNQKNKSVIPPLMVLGFIVLMLVFGIFMFMKFFVPDYLRRGMQEDLLQSPAIVAQAEILSIANTGRSYAKTPVIQLTLNVMPENQKNFQLIMEQEISWLQLNQMIPGRKIEIRYNPENHQEAVINQR